MQLRDGKQGLLYSLFNSHLPLIHLFLWRKSKYLSLYHLTQLFTFWPLVNMLTLHASMKADINVTGQTDMLTNMLIQKYKPASLQYSELKDEKLNVQGVSVLTHTNRQVDDQRQLGGLFLNWLLKFLKKKKKNNLFLWMFILLLTAQLPIKFLFCKDDNMNLELILTTAFTTCFCFFHTCLISFNT